MSEPEHHADALLKALIWKRFTERYEHLPHSVEHHLLTCESSEVADLTFRETTEQGMTFTEHWVRFTALIWCEHIQTEWEWGEFSTLPSILEDMAELQRTS